MFYGSAALLLFGAFVMRYRFELIFIFPLALIMAISLALGFKPDSPIQPREAAPRARFDGSDRSPACRDRKSVV